MNQNIYYFFYQMDQVIVSFEANSQTNLQYKWVLKGKQNHIIPLD